MDGANSSWLFKPIEAPNLWNLYSLAIHLLNSPHSWSNLPTATNSYLYTPLLCFYLIPVQLLRH